MCNNCTASFCTVPSTTTTELPTLKLVVYGIYERGIAGSVDIVVRY